MQGILRVIMRPYGIENATHNTFPKLTWIFASLFKKHKTWLAVQFRKF
jgi:hypothetical protein